ncbi:transcription factor Zelda-like isoform X2 [Eurosta solidaginis]|uniref:transcription factor Zelda-like isoform X2 n=1 Tax=Eurosta solidaginis TaxID=178769 RepID=UPI0035311D50
MINQKLPPWDNSQAMSSYMQHDMNADTPNVPGAGQIRSPFDMYSGSAGEVGGVNRSKKFKRSPQAPGTPGGQPGGPGSNLASTNDSHQQQQQQQQKSQQEQIINSLINSQPNGLSNLSETYLNVELNMDNNDGAGDFNYCQLISINHYFVPPVV